MLNAAASCGWGVPIPIVEEWLPWAIADAGNVTTVVETQVWDRPGAQRCAEAEELQDGQRHVPYRRHVRVLCVQTVRWVVSEGGNTDDVCSRSRVAPHVCVFSARSFVFTCRFTRSYLHLLMKSDTTGPQLISYHNIAYMMQLTRGMRQAIIDGR